MADVFAKAVISVMIAACSFAKTLFALPIWIIGRIRNAIIVPAMVNKSISK